MMKLLRNNLLKNIFGIVLLCMMLVKMCAYSISCFSSCTDPLAIEKNAEEGKDSKESPFDKADKKLFSCDAYADYVHILWINYLPVSIYSYKMMIGSHPVKTVPTPPPDSVA